MNRINILGINYAIVKQSKGYTGVKYNRNIGKWYETKQELLSNAEKDVKNLIEMNKIRDIPNILKQAQVASHFKLVNRIFNKAIGFPFPIDPVIKALCGRTTLDVIFLDKLVKTPDGVSCKEHIRNTYGEYTLKVVEFCTKYL